MKIITKEDINLINEIADNDCAELKTKVQLEIAIQLEEIINFLSTLVDRK